MTFDEWITDRDITYAAAAELIGVANATVARRYAKGLQLPNRIIMARIYAVTAGLVTPNDFFGLPGPSLPPAPEVDAVGDDAQIGGDLGGQGAGCGPGAGQQVQGIVDAAHLIGGGDGAQGHAGHRAVVGGGHG